MGCCLSTSANPQKQQRRRHCPSGHGRGCGGKAAPHPLMEEEAVKEVLSETPAVKPPPPPPPPPKVEVERRINAPPTPKLKLALKKVEEEEEKIAEKKVPVFSVEEISEVSEICSMSESVSTTTVTERRDDDDRSRDGSEAVRQRVARSPARFQSNPRSLSGDLGGRRERKSPARRLEQPSPGRVRSASARDGAQCAGKQTDGRRGQHLGENGGRRSRSPATRAENGAPRSGIGRSPSARKAAQSPSNISAARAAAGGSGRKVDQTEKEGKWPASAGPATNESLENPLVSLECFIFL